MKQKLYIIILLTLLAAIVLTACDLSLSRRGDDAGDIAVGTPAMDISAGQETPPPSEAPPTTEAPATTESPPGETAEEPEISPEISSAPEAPNAFEQGQILIKLKPQAAIQARRAELGPLNVPETDISSLDQRLQEIGATELEPVLEDVANVMGQNIDVFSAQALQVGQLFTVNFPPDKNPIDVAQILAADNNVEFAEPNYIAGITSDPQYIPTSLDPNDKYFSFQWNMQTIQMPQAWNMSTGQGVLVAVIDTGIDFRAPDLADHNPFPGYDFANNDNDPTDDQGHGTHVAGTIAQSTNNGTGVAGVAFNAQLLPIKVLGSNGNGSYANIIKGITYAVNRGAQVINMSLAGRQGSQGLREAVQYAHDRGVVVIAAAGNSAASVEFPAAYDDFVIAVGATRFDNTRTRYSNFGPQIDLVAPGGDVHIDQNQDTYADGILQQSFKTPGKYTYLFFEGTSMASPHVAGLAALILSRDPNLSPAQVESIMLNTARNLGPPQEYGAGLIQAADALISMGQLPQPPTDTPTPIPPQSPTDTPTPIPPQPSTDTPTPIPPQPSTDTPTPILPQPPTDTPTPVPPQPPTDTPTPLPAGQLLLNGDFESNEGWRIIDTPLDPEYDTSIVFSGNQSVKLGNPSGPDITSYTSVRQEAVIPAEAAHVTLTANIYPMSQDAPGNDIQMILVLNSYGKVIRTLSWGLSNSQTWENHSYDLSDFSGQTIFIYFGVFNRGGTNRPSAMYVDDVALSWSR